MLVCSSARHTTAQMAWREAPSLLMTPPRLFFPGRTKSSRNHESAAGALHPWQLHLAQRAKLPQAHICILSGGSTDGWAGGKSYQPPSSQKKGCFMTRPIIPPCSQITQPFHGNHRRSKRLLSERTSSSSHPMDRNSMHSEGVGRIY